MPLLCNTCNSILFRVYLYGSPLVRCGANNPSEGLLAEHDARVHIVRLYLIICAHCVLNASENDTEKT